jgi:4-amino-4-deoxy-L-arabinose transferase-like glycosyltransferase
LLLVDELRDAWRTTAPDHQRALLVVFSVAVALRLMYLAQPMRYDEAVTYMYFVRLPWSEALATYTYPNNHLFHTLLAKISVSVFGNTPWALRLPAFFAGVLVVFAAYAVARALYGDRAALLAAAFVSASGVLILYSTNARGYSLVVLAFLLLVLLVIRVLRGGDARQWIAFVVLATLGLWTVPVMLFPLGAVCVWFALTAFVDRKTELIRPLMISLVAVGALTLLAYSPVIARHGLASVTRNRFVAPSGWYEFFDQLPDTLWEALVSWSLGLPPLVTLVLLGCALFALRHHGSISPFRMGLPLAAFVWSAWLLVVTHRAPFARVWLWLLPIAASLAGAGLVRLLERWERTRRLAQERTPALAVVYVVGAALSIVLSFAVLLSRDTGTFREAAEASEALSRALRPGDRVLVGIPSNGPLEYYLHQRGVDPRHLSLDDRVARRVFVVVDRGEGQSLERFVGRSILRDSSVFTPPAVLAEFPASAIFLFQRRDSPTR